MKNILLRKCESNKIVEIKIENFLKNKKIENKGRTMLVIQKIVLPLNAFADILAYNHKNGGT